MTTAFNNLKNTLDRALAFDQAEPHSQTLKAMRTLLGDVEADVDRALVKTPEHVVEAMLTSGYDRSLDGCYF